MRRFEAALMELENTLVPIIRYKDALPITPELMKETMKAKWKVEFGKDMGDFSFYRYLDYFLDILQPLIFYIEDPKGDGNCGFRALAMALGGQTEILWFSILEEERECFSELNPAVMAVVRGGSYDSTTVGAHTSGVVTLEQDFVNFHNKYFWMFKDDQTKDGDYGFSGDKEKQYCHCVNQVDKVRELWSKDDNFQNEYIRCNRLSAVRRLGTLDGCRLGPDEDPPILHNVRRDRVVTAPPPSRKG
ncbi:hypothetical protein IFM89_019745 [Coptis chinensis]|uniref:OTU domain-containing protein n=1 Tax=Coptis chinensis TaxID=261450 RepID=A0A835LEY1_9MAGN|nr:hypothetical protein IFM89_019745 [Coptis chinensis]